MTVYKYGTSVTTKSGNHTATITAFTVREKKVQYEISYFFDGNYKTAWLDEIEFIPAALAQKTRIGFK